MRHRSNLHTVGATCILPAVAEQNSIQVSTRLRPSEVAQLVKIAEANERSLSRELRLLIRGYLKTANGT